LPLLLLVLAFLIGAMLLLSAFSAISTELKNPVILNILYNRGMKNMYLPLELAFSALPGLMDSFSFQALKVKGFGKFVQAMLVCSQALLNEFLSFESKRPTLYIICGDVNQCKTALRKWNVGDVAIFNLPSDPWRQIVEEIKNGIKSYKEHAEKEAH
jgi:hypothetical protein